MNIFPAKNKFALTAILLLVSSLSAWAEQYVFISNETNGYFIGSDAKATQTFTEGTCVWTCCNTDNTTENTLGGNDRRLHIGSTYLDGKKGKTGTVATGTTRNAYWRASGDNLCYYTDGKKTRQVYRDGTNVKWRDGDPSANGFRIYSYEKVGASLSPSIDGKSVINANGSYSYTSTSTATPLYYTFTGPDTRYYSEGYTGATTVKPTGSAVSGVTYTYSLSTNSYATVDASTGVVTVTSLPASGSVKLTLTVTASKSGYTSGTATKEIYLTREDHVTETGQYVICYNNQYFLGGTNTNRIEGFNPATCLWTGTSGGKWQNSGGGWLYNDGTFISTTNSSNFTLGGTENGATGRYLYTRSGDNTYYIRYNSGSWGRSTSTTGRNVVYAVTKTTYIGTDVGELTISGADELNALGASSTYTHNTLTRQDDYVDYVFYNGNHHYFDMDGNSITGAPVETFTYAWTLTGANGYATVNASSGVITYSQSPETDLPVTLTLTATGNKGTTVTATKTVTLKAMPKFWFTVKTVANPVEGGTATVKNASNAQVTEYTFSAFGTSLTATSATANVSLTATAAAANYRWQSWTGVTANAATANNVSVTSTSKDQANPTLITATAIFEKAPTFYLRAEAVADPAVGGTVTASIDGGTASATATAGKDGDFSTHYTYQTFNLSYTATPAANYTFDYWHDGAGNTLSTNTTYSASNVRATSKDEANPTVNRVYAKFSTLPTSITVDTLVVGVGASGQNSLVVKLLPAGSVRYLKFLIDASDAYAFVDESTGLVTGKKAGQTTVTVVAYENAARTIEACRATGVIIVRDVCKTPVITFSPIDEGLTASTTLTSETEGATLYYQVKPDGGDRPTEWTVYTAPFTVNDLDRVYAYADKPDDDKFTASKETNLLYSSHKVATPTISISSTGSVSFDCADEPDVIYYYTTDGSTPTTSSSSWTSGSSAITGLANETEVKVMATKAGCQNSDVASKTVYFTALSGNTVYLNDYEDHTWTYYAGVDASVDGGYYNTNYLNKIYSPDPRNVKITYRGGGVANASAVAISGASGEGQNEMVYYKTIEKTQIGETGNYAYHVIPNPFSKRPRTTGSTGTNGYYGFGGWKLVSGGEHITEYSNGETLPLEPTIHFTNLDEGYTANCTSAEIVFEATWVPATVYVQNTKPNFNGGTYETNFWVLNSNPGASVTLNQNMTFTQVTPDGGATNDYRNTVMTRDILFNHGDGVTPKIEFMNRNNGTAINPNGKNLYIGRGVTNQTTSSFYGSNGNSAVVNQVVRVESGNFGNAYHYHATPGSITRHIFIWGCDYDRAKGINTNLTIAEAMLADNYSITSNENQYTALIYIKSGRFAPNGNDNDGGANLYYVGMKTTVNNAKDGQGMRYMEIQGGELRNIAGASTDHKNQRETIAFRMRMKGGTIHGMAFGCARGNPSYGSRAFILTGGKSEGWLSPGSNGNNATLTGYLYGRTYLYAGGNFIVDSDGSTARMNRSVGGNLFGSGCGYDADRTTGGCELGSNVVVADNVYVERGVYAGGSFGYSDGISYIYVTGGHVAGFSGGISSDGTSYNADIQGGIYGGSCQNKGNSANIIMTGGRVDTGIYGGSNRKGTMSGYTNILITGGTVNGNVHGGGFGENTAVDGNVDLSIGIYDTSTGSTLGDAVINGDVYGGSALGSVNDAATDHTNVTLNAGTIYGSLYGGALGNASTAANVYGPVQVTVRGGSVKGEGHAIYGCNNANGAPQRTVAVDIWNTDPAETEGDYAIYAVFGGGNQANYNGTPSVTVHNCDNSIEYVYGGGNAATVTGTEVLIEGGNVLGNVFGGGYGANVNGDINLTITGGHILNAFGGNNNSGAVTGEIYITVAQSAPTCDESAQHASGECPVDIDKLCGGGNMAASNVAHIDIGCCDHIGTVYGGAEAANMTGDIDLQIKAGNIETVFGGNNQSGTIYGDITVTANWDTDTYTCESSLGTVYGGGNLAEYTGNTTVNILNCEMSGNVFGGGKGTRNDGTGAHVVGSTAVNIGDWKEGHSVSIGGSVFGGGDEAAVEGYTTVTIRDCATLIEGDVYGGGNAAPVYGTRVTVWGGNIYGNVFGGGNGQDLSKPGANVGYDRSNLRSTTAEGNAVTAIYGGIFGEPDGEGGFVQNTGGIFGGSNSRGDIKGAVDVTLDGKSEAEVQTADERTAWGTGTKCTLDIQEAYGAGNVAEFNGQSITFTLGCIDAFKEIYGGAKNANLTSDIHLIITSGHFKRVFAGNNIGGCLKGSLKVTVDEIGCNPLIIDALYGGGNRAAYSVYGYNDDGTVRTAADTGGEKVYTDPEVEVISCTHIGNIYGAGEGSTAIVVGDPKVFIDQIPGMHSEDAEVASYVNEDKLGSIGNVYGGGNAADVKGDTHVNIGTKATQAHLEFDPDTRQYTPSDETSTPGANISGNVYGGGNQAKVEGQTHVQIGQ